MRKSLYALSFAVLSGVPPASAQSQEMPRSFADTLKIILFGDARKDDFFVETFLQGKKDTVQIALTAFDAKSCSATIIARHDSPAYAVTRVTTVVDFKAATAWNALGAAGFVTFNSDEKLPIFKSVRVEWLRIYSKEVKRAEGAVDIYTCFKACFLYSHQGSAEQTEKAMDYLLNKLCPNPNRPF